MTVWQSRSWAAEDAVVWGHGLLVVLALVRQLDSNTHHVAHRATVIHDYCDTSSHSERRPRILKWSVHRQWTVAPGPTPPPPCGVGSWGPSFREDSRRLLGPLCGISRA
jgi:hypothetical protein